MAGMRRALLVGNNKYTKYGDLAGCTDDVDRLKPLLASHADGTPNFACRVLYDAGRDDLVAGIKTLLSPGADVALLYFAGHGAAHQNDVSLCTIDATEHSPGLGISEILAMVQQASIREVIIVLDCCFAGGGGGVPQLGGTDALLCEGVTILAASRGDQTSAETLDGGLFTISLADALDGGAADVVGKVNVAGLYAYLSELFGPWDQRPTFKANVDRLHDIRLCEPAVPLDKLRRLTEFFPTLDHELRLDPSYEPKAKPPHAEHEAIFAILQLCRAAKLVEPVGHEHLYFAAVEDGSCRLTPLGRHYWRLVNHDLL